MLESSIMLQIIPSMQQGDIILHVKLYHYLFYGLRIVASLQLICLMLLSSIILSLMSSKEQGREHFMHGAL